MSASDALSYQMRMFVPAAELADPAKTYHADFPHYRDHESMRRVKVSESSARGTEEGVWNAGYRGDSLRKSVKERGILTPVEMEPPSESGTTPKLLNGHHRVFTAADLDPKTEIPVEWET